MGEHRGPRDPQQEKERDYEKQRRALVGESRHAERRQRPRRRALTHRSHRRSVEQALQAPAGVADEEAAADMQDAAEEARLPSFEIWNPMSLGEAIQDRRRYRAAEAGRVYFREGYDGPRHREPFSRFLESVLSGQVAPAAELAEQFQRLLQGRGVGGEFVAAFLVDEPAWRERLESWISATLED